jgi:hypothetical protein
MSKQMILQNIEKHVMYCAHNLFVDMPRRFYNAFLFLCIYGKIKLSLFEHVK